MMVECHENAPVRPKIFLRGKEEIEAFLKNKEKSETQTHKEKENSPAPVKIEKTPEKQPVTNIIKAAVSEIGILSKGPFLSDG